MALEFEQNSHWDYRIFALAKWHLLKFGLGNENKTFLSFLQDPLYRQWWWPNVACVDSAFKDTQNAKVPSLPEACTD